MSSPISNRLRVVAFGRANSRSPSSPWKRPNPLSPTPPNGTDGMPTNVSTELIVVPPARSRSAISGPRFAENTDEPSPKSVRVRAADRLVLVRHGVDDDDRAERLLLHRRRLLRYVDEDDRVDVGRLDRVEPADERGGAARPARR